MNEFYAYNNKINKILSSQFFLMNLCWSTGCICNLLLNEVMILVWFASLKQWQASSLRENRAGDSESNGIDKCGQEYFSVASSGDALKVYGIYSHDGGSGRQLDSRKRLRKSLNGRCFRFWILVQPICYQKDFTQTCLNLIPCHSQNWSEKQE